MALLLALIQTPHRFRSKRQLWAYASLALITRTSADYRLQGASRGVTNRMRFPDWIKITTMISKRSLRARRCGPAVCPALGAGVSPNESSRVWSRSWLAWPWHASSPLWPHSLEERRTLQRWEA